MFTGRQLAAGRALAGLTQRELAKVVNISVSTLSRIEASKETLRGSKYSIHSVVAVLEKRGIEFTSGDALGVQVRVHL